MSSWIDGICKRLPASGVGGPVIAVCLVGACGGKVMDPPPIREGPTAGGSGATPSTGGAASQLTPYSDLAGMLGGRPIVYVSVQHSCRSSTLTGTDDCYTSLDARAFDGPTPTVVQSTVFELGNCKLLIPPKCKNPFCQAGDICVNENTCAAYPNPIGDYTLDVSGLRLATGETEFQGSANVNKVYQFPSSLAEPACAQGDRLSVSGSIGSQRVFQLETTCIAPLPDLWTGPPIVLTAGNPATITWPRSTGFLDARVSVVLNGHMRCQGQPYILCDAPDTGDLVIDAEMVDRYLALGSSGPPRVDLTRYAFGSVITDSVAAIFVYSTFAEMHLVLGEQISCEFDSECPSGSVCSTVCPYKSTCVPAQ